MKIVTLDQSPSKNVVHVFRRVCLVLFLMAAMVVLLGTEASAGHDEWCAESNGTEFHNGWYEMYRIYYLGGFGYYNEYRIEPYVYQPYPAGPGSWDARYVPGGDPYYVTRYCNP